MRPRNDFENHLDDSGRRREVLPGMDNGEVVPGCNMAQATCDSGFCAKGLSDNDKSQAAIGFYWVTPGDKKVSVKFTLTVDGRDYICKRPLTIGVVAPTVDTTRPANDKDIGKAIAQSDGAVDGPTPAGNFS